ncbi:MAG: lysine biosynthesis protein LysW [Candidatus Levybacteria bacterium]|nr:lysine biosynthesis protein LysW [Candidatus Daviesbacteria bacterium]MBI4078836.1 lysine biosynthesis protein LysW [Candidatus Levybacteria bacterium]
MQQLQILSSECVVCDADVKIPQNTQVSEVISCAECKTGLVIENIKGTTIRLSKAPVVEEDWGE